MGVSFLKDILVVEDDKMFARVLKMRLEASGFKVFTESLGLPALGFAAEHLLDLVVLDIHLPDMSGLEICSKLRKLRGPTLPVLMLTGLDKPADQLEGFGYGADDYLTKPYDAQELLKTVELLLGSPSHGTHEFVLSR